MEAGMANAPSFSGNIIKLHRPETVFVLGPVKQRMWPNLITRSSLKSGTALWRGQGRAYTGVERALQDEGEWTDDEQFNEYVDRFHNLFSLPDDIKMFVSVGSHDIGFHVSISPTEYAVNKCGVPRETTIILSAIIMICILFVFVLWKGKRAYL